MSRVMCHMSPVMCHLSPVTCCMLLFFFNGLKKWTNGVELVGGGSVINGASPSSFSTGRIYKNINCNHCDVQQFPNKKCLVNNVILYPY